MIPSGSLEAAAVEEGGSGRSEGWGGGAAKDDLEAPETSSFQPPRFLSCKLSGAGRLPAARVVDWKWISISQTLVRLGWVFWKGGGSREEEML